MHRSRSEPEPGAPGGRSDDELKRNRRNVLIVAAILLAVGGITSRSSWFGTTFHFGSGHRDRGPVVIDAQQVYNAYRDDAHAAARRFRGHEMVVSGEFVRIVPDAQGNPDLRLKTSDPEAPLGADLVPMSYDQAARLKPGQRVTVSCQRITADDDRWLQNCAIQTDAGDKAAAPASSPAVTPPPPPSPPEGNHG
jgi:tRNA_anti-like